MSTSSPDRLIGIRAKIERAKNHVHDLKNKILAFRETNPYRLLCDKDSQPGKQIFRLQVLGQMPQDFPIITGEAIHQLRSSLDHLAWQLVDANGNTAGNWTSFPISETVAKYKASSPGKVKGMHPSAINLIDSINPYKGPNDGLWMLHELNNIDKHRLVLGVACGIKRIGFSYQANPDSFARFGIDPAFVRKLQADSNAEFSAMLADFGPELSMPGPIPQDGAELATFENVPQLDYDFDLSFEIAFWQPEIVQSKTVVPLLNELTCLVERTVNLFLPFL